MSNLQPNPDVYSDLYFPAIKKPKLDGYFSLDVNRRYVNNLRNLKYVQNLDELQEISFDLNTKLNQYEEKPESAKQEKLEHILEYILINYDRLNNPKQNCLNCDIICFRGTLRLIMTSPYEKKEDFIILATKFKNSIYLCSMETDRKKLERINRPQHEKKFLKYGFIFEQFMLSDDPKKPPNTKKDVIEAEEFCCMFSTKLEKHQIFYGAEMDGVKSKTVIQNLDELRNAEFVELKLKRKESNERQLSNFYKFKAKNWWAQSFLVGIDKICVGIRDDSGVVHEVVNMAMRDLVHKSKSFWSASICVKFLDDFLTKVKKDLTGINCPHTVFMYSYDPLKDKEISLSKFTGENVHSFLPKHYINFLNENY